MDRLQVNVRRRGQLPLPLSYHRFANNQSPYYLSAVDFMERLQRLADERGYVGTRRRHWRDELCKLLAIPSTSHV